MTDPAEDQSKIYSVKKSSRWPWVIGVLALVLAAVYGAAVLYVSGDVPPGTTVRGVPIGGMTTQKAASKLAKELQAAAEERILVSANGKDLEIVPTDAGLSVDWSATAAQATGVVFNPIQIIKHLAGDVSLEPITIVDQAELTKTVEALAEVANTEPTEPEITFSKAGVPEVKPGADGEAIDVQPATKRLADSYFLPPDDGLIELPLIPTAPTVPDADAEKVLTDFAQPAVSGDVTLAVASKTNATIAPADIAANLTFPIKDGAMVPTLDGKGLRKDLADQLEGVDSPGKDATFKIVDDKPVVVPSKSGKSINNDDLSTAVLAVLPLSDPSARLATVKVTASDAAFTTADAKALNIVEKLSTFKQPYPPAEYRYINVGTAAKFMNGTILKPGDTFSMNDTVHERTRANGYTEGTIIQGGRFKEDLGGGVSIITTATWTAAFYAGLERVEQTAHGLYISRYKAGLEATVSWGYIDLKFRNDTGNGVLITATRYNDGVRVSMWGTRKWDKVTSTFTDRHSFTDYQTIYDDSPTCVAGSGSQGFSISVTRKLILDGKTKRSETWPTTYKPTSHVICAPKPSPKPKPDPKATEKPSPKPSS